MFLQELRSKTIISLAMIFIIAGTAIAQKENLIKAKLVKKKQELYN